MQKKKVAEKPKAKKIPNTSMPTIKGNGQPYGILRRREQQIDEYLKN